MAKTIDFDIDPSGIEFYTTTDSITITNPWEGMPVIADISEFNDKAIPLIMKPIIKKVIFNPPATIVFFTDKTKMVVKCNEDDVFNPWAGMALCICKKLYGAEFHKSFRTHCKEES